MTDPHRDELIERVVSAHRPRTPSGALRAHPAWHDLDDEGRVEAHARTTFARRLEAALDADGHTSTTRAVLAIIQGQRVR